MRIVYATVFLVLLAGCAGPAPSQAPMEYAPTAVAEHESVDASVLVMPPWGCKGGMVCTPGSVPHEIYRAADDRSLREVQLEARAVEGFTDPVAWRVVCYTYDSNDPACKHDLANGTGPLPVSIDIRALELPAASSIFLELTGPPEVYTLNDVLGRSSQVRGQVTLTPVARLPPPDSVPVSLDGHSGPCIVVDDCGRWPGGSDLQVPVSTVVIAANLTMTWTATSPLDSELGLSIHWRACPMECPDEVYVEGPSPLVLVADGLRFDSGVEVRVWQTNPVVGGTGYHGTRTPVHIAGEVWVPH